MYTVLVEDDYGLDRDALMARLRERASRRGLSSTHLHRLPMYDHGPALAGGRGDRHARGSTCPPARRSRRTEVDMVL